jgi:hypothetical protein
MTTRLERTYIHGGQLYVIDPVAAEILDMFIQLDEGRKQQVLDYMNQLLEEQRADPTRPDPDLVAAWESLKV